MKRSIRNAAVSIAALTASPALAQVATTSTPSSAGQDAPAGVDPAPTATDDIVVTATRESTLLSKTPIALTAITGQGLRDTGITDARSLGNNVPNLNIAQTGQITIRGVSSTDTTEKGDPSAAFLMDGIYIARPGDVLGSFYDIERVEVLRGPQGTLYGRNTTAGVVNVISARPVYKFAASVDGEYGNMDNRNVTGMVNVPLGSSLAIRAAVNYDRQDNYLRKGVPMAIDLDPFRDALSGRLSIGGEIGKFNFVVRGDYAEFKGVNIQTLPLANFYGPLTPTIDPVYIAREAEAQRSLNVALTAPGTRNNKAYGVTGEFSYDFGFAELTYLGSYRETKRDELFSGLLNGVIPQRGVSSGDYRQQSHELRAAFGRGQPLHGQVGGYFFREKSANSLVYGAPISQLVGGANGVGYGFVQDPTISRSIAGFGQLTYDLTSNLHVTGGIRYTEDEKSRVGATILDVRNPATSVVTRITVAPNNADRTFKKTTWRAGVDYDAPGLGLIYGSVSTGYKAGGFNDGCVAGTGTGCTLSQGSLYYQPETLTAYELGFKFRFLDNAFRLNASAFHYDYSGLQLSQVAGSPPVTLTRNAAKAKVDGIELEAAILPGSNDRFDLSFVYTDARYTNFFPNPVARPTLSFDGRQLDRAPKEVAAAGYTHTFPLGNGSRIEAAARTRLSSEYFLQDLNNLSQFRQPSFTKTDVTLTYRAPEGQWYIQGFAKNLENAITLTGAASGLTAGVQIEEPRTYGVRAGFKF